MAVVEIQRRLCTHESLGTLQEIKLWHLCSMFSLHQQSEITALFTLPGLPRHSPVIALNSCTQVWRHLAVSIERQLVNICIQLQKGSPAILQLNGFAIETKPWKVRRTQVCRVECWRCRANVMFCSRFDLLHYTPHINRQVTAHPVHLCDLIHQSVMMSSCAAPDKLLSKADLELQKLHLSPQQIY